ncbi:MAG: hypothetical protein ACLVIY_02580 [Anaerobutyricum soehngenii]
MERSREEFETNTKEAATTSGKIPEREQNFWNKYLNQLEHFHYEEEQRAYYQGMMDVVEFLINIGAIKKSTNVKRMMEKYAR